MEQQVVVTGLGLIAPKAFSARQLFDRLSGGNSCIGVHPKFARYKFPSPYAAFIPENVWAQLAHDPAVRGRREFGPTVHLANYAAAQAVAESKVDFSLEASKGLFVGSNKYSISEEDYALAAPYFSKIDERVDLDGFLDDVNYDHARHFHKSQDTAAIFLSRLHGFENHAATHADACAAGGVSIGSAYRFIRHGEIASALAGASEAMSDFMPYLGFAMVGALNQKDWKDPEKASRPFEKNRCGFVMGEGSGFVVLETKDRAEARGAKPLAEIVGFSKNCEAVRITSSDDAGESYAACMEAALDDARISPEHIDHINLHGTSTVQNDSCESKALYKVFGERAKRIPSSANKSALGHSLAASGALEFILSVLSIQKQFVLPTLNYDQPDQSLPRLGIFGQGVRFKIDYVMSNSFGFGGENCSIILKRPSRTS